MAKLRLDKLLSDQSSESRGDLKKEIRKYGVKINDQLIKDPGKIIDTEQDVVIFRNREVTYNQFIYIMLNKPAGIVSAVTDDRDKTVIDHIKDVYPRKDYFPVGRLDKDTEGLLIITNNGQLAHQVLSPKKHIPKKYYVEIDGEIGVKEIESLEKGVLLEDGYLTKKAKAELIESKDDYSSIYLTITEGKFHQVKRMIKAVGFEVSYLKRVAMGSLELDSDLNKGDFRELTDSEVTLLKGDYNGTD